MWFWSVAGEEDTPIGAMPGCYRLGWRHGLVQEVWLCVFDLIPLHVAAMLQESDFLV